MGAVRCGMSRRRFLRPAGAGGLTSCYTLVGSVSRPRFLASPSASLPAVLNLLFGTITPTDMELAYAESGRLIKS